MEEFNEIEDSKSFERLDPPESKKSPVFKSRNPFEFLSRSDPREPPIQLEPLEPGPYVLKILKKRRESSSSQRSGLASPKILVRKKVPDSPATPSRSRIKYEANTPGSVKDASESEFSEFGESVWSPPSRTYEENFEIKSTYPALTSSKAKVCASALYSLLENSEKQEIDLDYENRAINELQHIKFQKNITDTERKPKELKFLAQKNVSRFVPLDWVLKKEVTLLCNKPFNIMSLYQSLPNDARDSRIKGLLSCIDSHLTRWVHPANSLPPGYSKILPHLISKRAENVKLNASDLLELEYYDNMKQDWNDSFKSLYNSLHLDASYFYCILPEYIILFCKESRIEVIKNKRTASPAILAIVSPVTAGMEKMLEKLGINFLRTSNNPSKKPIPTEEDKIQADYTIASEFNTTSLIIFDKESVSKFAKYISKDANFSKGSLPVLVSEKSFINASLQKAKIVKNSKVRYNINNPVDRNKIEVMYKLKILGIILPKNLIFFLNTIKAEQSRSFELSEQKMILTSTFTPVNASAKINEGYLFAKSLLTGEQSTEARTSSQISTLNALLYTDPMVMWK